VITPARAPFSNRAFNLRLRVACRKLGIPRSRRTAAPFGGDDFAQPCGQGSAGNLELLRHKDIKTTVRYTHVAYEQNRETAEALSHALG